MKILKWLAINGGLVLFGLGMYIFTFWMVPHEGYGFEGILYAHLGVLFLLWVAAGIGYISND